MNDTKQTKNNTFFYVFIIFWMLLVFIPIGYLMGKHEMSFSPNFRKNSISNNEKKWQAFHFLSSDCLCSRDVFHYLESRGTVAGLIETIVLFGDSEKEVKSIQSHLSRKGFRTQITTEKEISERDGIQGTPTFVLLQPNGDVAYQGGYSQDRPGSLSLQNGKNYKDLDIWKIKTASKQPPITPFPVFGCASNHFIK